MNSDWIRRLIAVSQSLEQHGADCVLIGGAAAAVHGVSVATEDLDFCCSPDPDNLARVAEAIRPFRPVFRNKPKGLPLPDDRLALVEHRNRCFHSDMGQLDFVVALDFAGDAVAAGQFPAEAPYAVVKAASEKRTIQGQPLWVLGIPALIASKQAVGRPKDRAVIAELAVIASRRGTAGR